MLRHVYRGGSISNYMEVEASQPLQAQEEYHRLTLQTLHRWTDGWRPSEMIAFDVQEARVCVSNITLCLLKVKMEYIQV